MCHCPNTYGPNCMSCIQCGHCPSKVAESAEQPGEDLLEDLLEDTECRLQAPTLDSMLFRMEEIQVRATNRRARRKSAWNLIKSLEIVVLFIVSFGPVMQWLVFFLTSSVFYVRMFVSEQRDQDEVRKRFATIAYSDPLYWDQQGAAGKIKTQ